MTPEQHQLTRLLAEAGKGDPLAREQLTPLVYEEMRRLAHRQLRGGRRDRTFGATALIHEAYLKLLGAHVEWQDRVHFYATAARAMRLILVDSVRSAARGKRGGGAAKVTLDEGMAIQTPNEDLLAVDEALRKLEEVDARKARLVELHYFGGLSYEEIAGEEKISEATVHRELRMAKAWLRQALQPPSK
jgi:RNA polymerase sigma factor (TIGR02999 family)